MKSILALAIIFSASLAYALDGSFLTLKPELQRGDIHNPQGFWPLVGFGVGAMDHNTSIRTGGIPTHIKALGSYYFEQAPVVADVGLGLHNEFLTQGGEGADIVQSFYSEVAGRYRLTNRWQLGAIWSTLVDNPDRYRSNTDNLASFTGLQVLKEFTWDETYMVRAGGRAMTDVGISGETIDTVMAEIEVSFGPSKSMVVESAPDRALAPHLVTRAVKSWPLDPRNVNFKTDSIAMINNSKPYLRRLSRALAANQQLFDRVEIIGHADQRGPELYNDQLSVRRAHVIAQSLISAGLASSQVVAVGRGESDPLASGITDSALLKNRRVELKFHGVKNPHALQNIIDSLQ